MKKPISFETASRRALVEALVVPDSSRCVQCGICSYNCPIEIDVRRHAWQGLPVRDSHCLTCGECVARCPRAVLRFERTDLLSLRSAGGDPQLNGGGPIHAPGSES